MAATTPSLPLRGHPRLGAVPDVSWLEDFLALASCGNFSRAAEKRNISQPALSRRIKSLENWAGAPLFDRTTHRMSLTPAGERFQPIAEECLRLLHLGREEIREAARHTTETLRFACTHALSITHFPKWIGALEMKSQVAAPVRLIADNMAACERIMLEGQAQFLLCHHHPSAPTALGSERFLSVAIGDDMLVPVSAPEDGGREPRYPLPGEETAPLPYLAYAAESGMGRIIAAARIGMPPVWLTPGFTSHVAMVLVAMARDGRGIAWLPYSLVSQDLSIGTLVRAGPQSWDVPMEIRLMRPRSRQSPTAEKFWASIVPDCNP